MERLGGLKSLLVSRKVWLAILALIGALIAYSQGLISAEQLVEAIVALAVVLIAAIAGEDMAEKAGAGKPAKDGD